MYRMSLVHLCIKPRQTCQHLGAVSYRKLHKALNLRYSFKCIAVFPRRSSTVLHLMIYYTSNILPVHWWWEGHFSSTVPLYRITQRVGVDSLMTMWRWFEYCCVLIWRGNIYVCLCIIIKNIWWLICAISSFRYGAFVMSPRNNEKTKWHKSATIRISIYQEKLCGNEHGVTTTVCPPGQTPEYCMYAVMQSV